VEVFKLLSAFQHRLRRCYPHQFLIKQGIEQNLPSFLHQRRNVIVSFLISVYTAIFKIPARRAVQRMLVLLTVAQGSSKRKMLTMDVPDRATTNLLAVVLSMIVAMTEMPLVLVLMKVVVVAEAAAVNVKCLRVG
jgi:hypothetical protein